jgi:hypothetical protein
MWSEIGTAALGFVAGYAASFFEPLRSRVARAGRVASSDLGIDVNIESDPEVIWAGMPNWIGFRFYFPGGIPETSPPADGRAWRKWAYGQGGCDSGESVVRITVVSRAAVTVVMETPIVICTAESAPPGQRAIYPVGGAAIQPVAFYIDVDMFGYDHPIVTLTGEQGDQVREPLTWSLTTGEAQTILLRVSSNSSDLVYWSARLPVIVDGERRFIDISADGADFEFAGSEAGDRDHFFDDDVSQPNRWSSDTSL